MLEQIKKAGQKLLITIDEASNTDFMKVFASAFQIFVRHNLPVFLLMTGLYENIRELQNEKILTFLYRAPRIELAPLNIGSIAENYRGSFQLSAESSLEMAKLTKGYPYAFQALGYYTWENNGDYKASVPLCRQTLEEYVYEKLWTELSATDRRVCSAISETPSGRIKEVREKLQMDSNEFSPYRDRLIRRGLVVGDIRGYIRFALPFFADFVQTTAV